MREWRMTDILLSK